MSRRPVLFFLTNFVKSFATLYTCITSTFFFNLKRRDKKEATMAYHLENFFEVYAKMMMS